MNRHLLGLTGALVASVAIAVPSATADLTANVAVKKAALMGKASSNSARPEQMVSRLIVKLRNTSTGGLATQMSASKVQALSRTAGAGMKSIRSMAGDASLLGLDAPMALSEAKAVAARLERDPSVEYAVPDIMLKKLLTPNEPNFPARQWNLFAPTATFTGAVLPAGGFKSATATGGANLELAWDVTTGSNSIVLAIVDTGIVNHPDLNGQPAGDIYIPNGRFLPGYDFISENVGAGTLPTNFVANDGDGRDADASDPGDWVTTQEETMYASQCDDGVTGPQNSSWHGSHMAGIAGAMTNNSIGHAGVGWNIRILPVRALGKCGGSLSDIGEAILWAAGVSVPGVPNNATPAQVINLSLGSDPGTPCDGFMQGIVNQAIAAGSVVVAATGNDGTIGLSSPAKCTGVIAVTSNTINGDNSDFANIGAASGSGPQATLSASGGGSPTSLGAGGPTDDPAWIGFYIWSSVLFGNTSPTSADSMNRTGPAYAGFTGTSPATPQVAGVAALIKSVPAAAAASPAFVKSWISAGGNVRPHPPGGACAVFLINCGKGLLDANLAVNAAVNLQPAVTTGPNLVVLPGTNVALSATATPYPGKAIASTIWSQTSGTVVTLNGATTTNVSFTAPASPATVVLRFRATDNAAKVADDFVSIRVNRPPVLGAVPPTQNVNAGQTVSFTVTASDPDGEPVFFSATALPTGATFTPAGVFTWDTTSVTSTTAATFTYFATDSISSSSTASVTINVAAAAPPPPPPAAVPPTGGGGGGGASPLWQLMLLFALTLGARIRSRAQ